jgi:hypothetical protein
LDVGLTTDFLSMRNASDALVFPGALAHVLDILVSFFVVVLEQSCVRFNLQT